MSGSSCVISSSAKLRRRTDVASVNPSIVDLMDSCTDLIVSPTLPDLGDMLAPGAEDFGSLAPLGRSEACGRVSLGTSLAMTSGPALVGGGAVLAIERCLTMAATAWAK